MINRIHGHTHSSLDYMVGDTRVICNPRGYARYDSGEENSDWNPSLLIDLDHKGFGDKADLGFMAEGRGDQEQSERDTL